MCSVSCWVSVGCFALLPLSYFISLRRSIVFYCSPSFLYWVSFCFLLCAFVLFLLFSLHLCCCSLGCLLFFYGAGFAFHWFVYCFRWWSLLCLVFVVFGNCVGLRFIVSSMVLAEFSLFVYYFSVFSMVVLFFIRFVIALACFFIVRVLLVHFRRASGPPHFLFSASSGVLPGPLDSSSSSRDACVAEGKLLYARFQAVVYGSGFVFIVSARVPSLSNDLVFKWIAR